jgi:hypothetical protein
MRIYITTRLIKQVELELLKLYKFCGLLSPDVTTNQEEKQAIAAPYGQFKRLAAPCSLQPGGLSIGQSRRNLRITTV